MTQIGSIIEDIFRPGVKYEDYVQDYQDYVANSGRLVTREEYDGLRVEASAAASGGLSAFVLSWSPRFHIAASRRVFTEMRAAHDRLFNILDAFLAWANSIEVAQSQMSWLHNDQVLKRAENQANILARIKTARRDQHTNVGNAIQAAQELARKYERDPFRGPAQDKREQAYYDVYAERVRYNDLVNQKGSLDIADLYDDVSVVGLAAEKQREYLDFDLTGRTLEHLQTREDLLGFDFTTRIVDALRDVLQNASEVVRVVSALWGLDRLERLALNYDTGDGQIGWYFALAPALWPAWVDRPINEVAEALMGDVLLAYLDKADVVLSGFEHNLQEFDGGAARGLVSVKLAFASDKNGVSRAVLPIPSYYRYQEISALYLKGMPLDVPSVEARIKDVRVIISRGADHRLHCEATLQDPKLGGMTFGSDSGMSGEAPIFALERECLACASSGNQPIALACRSASNPNFAVDCIVRVAGFSPGRA